MPRNADVRISRVSSFGATNPWPVTPNATPVTTLSDVSLGVSASAYNAEEVGYGWAENTTPLPDDASTPSGLYLIEVCEAATGFAQVEYAFFVVRRPTNAKILVCYPFATLNAYAGGAFDAHRNLYDSPDAGRLRRVSLDRPFIESGKQGRCVAYPFWMEAFIRNYEATVVPPDTPLVVDVCTSFDLEEDPTLLDGVTLFVSVGHDEYLSKTMTDRLAAHVAAGGNLAFFSANAVWWQVRFENGGRTMVCYKNIVEDPSADPTELTANFASPPSLEENRLTGVSFRRGTQGTTTKTFVVLDPLHPYMAGVLTATLGPPGLVSYETDGVEFEERDGKTMATGADGSPRDFQVIALADMRNEDLGPRGVAALGCYTNVGTVFTAATTEWAAFLADPGVLQVTRNVLHDLREPHTRDPLTFASRDYPTDTWSSRGQLSGDVPALCALFTGDILLQMSATTTASLRLEAPAPPPVTTIIPGRADLACYGTDIYGKRLYAGTRASGGNARAYRRWGNLYEGGPWSDVWTMPVPGDVKGVTSHNTGAIFANVQVTPTESGLRSTLLRAPFGNPSANTQRVARMYPPLHAIAAADGKIFALRDPAGNVASPVDLYCREASDVDLVPTKIGTAPAGSYALAAAQGRLFVLAGNTTTDPTLYWRTMQADPGFPYRAPTLLFLDGATYALGRIAGNGDFESIGGGTLSFAYTHATRANDDLVLFYNGANGSARVVRFNPDATFTEVKVYGPYAFGSWTHVVHVRAGKRAATDISPVQEKVLFYNSSGPYGYIGYFDTNGNYVNQWYTSAFVPGWTSITCTHNGDLFFYGNGGYANRRVDNAGAFFNQGSGSGLDPYWQNIVPAGHSYLWFQSISGLCSLAEIHNGSFSVLHNYSGLPPDRIATGAANGVVFTYGSNDGSAEAFGVSAHATASEARKTLRDFPAVFSPWSQIVALGVL